MHYIICLGNFSEDFTINNIKKTGLKGVVKFFMLILSLMVVTIF